MWDAGSTCFPLSGIAKQVAIRDVRARSPWPERCVGVFLRSLRRHIGHKFAQGSSRIIHDLDGYGQTIVNAGVSGATGASDASCWRFASASSWSCSSSPSVVGHPRESGWCRPLITTAGQTCEDWKAHGAACWVPHSKESCDAIEDVCPQLRIGLPGAALYNLPRSCACSGGSRLGIQRFDERFGYFDSFDQAHGGPD